MKSTGKTRRHRRIRKKISGTKDVPRLSVQRSLTNLHVQLVDDLTGKTMLCVSTLDAELKKTTPYGGNAKAATTLGEILAKQAKAKGIEKVVFDRGGCAYHGRIKAFAEAARKGGLKF